MASKKIGICCLQETRNAGRYDVTTEDGSLIIFLGRQENGYGGLGFYVSAAWRKRIASTRPIENSDGRIAVLRLHRAEPGDNATAADSRGNLVIINKYGYADVRTQQA